MLFKLIVPTLSSSQYAEASVSPFFPHTQHSSAAMLDIYQSVKYKLSENKKAGASESIKLPDTPACL